MNASEEVLGQRDDLGVGIDRVVDRADEDGDLAGFVKDGPDT